MQVNHLIKGLASFIPGLLRIFLKGTGGTDSSRYCYSVWLRHLVIAHKNDLSTNPEVLAELGPGDSLGVGLSAMLCGTDRYYAFDVVQYSKISKNLEILDELISMFKNREKIPDNIEFPNIWPELDSYEFPEYIFNDTRLEKSLAPDRIALIRQALVHSGEYHNEPIEISYYAPWDDDKVIQERTVDMVFSQCVMQYIDNLSHVYKVLSRWLKPDGYMSHEIDFTAFRASEKWNGYWAYTDLLWTLIKGKRQNLVNRAPHSTHIKLIDKYNFKIICDNIVKDRSGIQRRELAPRFKELTDEDLFTRVTFIQAVKLP